MPLGDHDKLLRRIRQIRRTNAPPGNRPPNDLPSSDRSQAEAPDPEQDRFEMLEGRVAHLEQLLEGLQDSVYRESERHAHLIATLQAQVDPGAMRSALAEEARDRGL